MFTESSYPNHVAECKDRSSKFYSDFMKKSSNNKYECLLCSHKEGFSFRMYRHIKNQHPNTSKSKVKVIESHSQSDELQDSGHYSDLDETENTNELNNSTKVSNPTLEESNLAIENWLQENITHSKGQDPSNFEKSQEK